MYSGGNWKNTTYGVSYATAPSLAQPEEWTQVEHHDLQPLVLRTLPGKVIGPGHNSVVRGPDNLQLFCVYHRWAQDGSGRLLALDRLEWVGDRMVVLGPSTTLQPAPLPPTFMSFDVDRMSGANHEPGWRASSGRWVFEPALARQVQNSGGVATLALPNDSFVVELNLRHLSDDSTGEYGTRFAAADDSLLSCGLQPGMRAALVRWRDEAGLNESGIPLAPGFDPQAYHLLRVELDGTTARIALDGLMRWRGTLAGGPDAISLFTRDTSAAFAGFSLTEGWYDLFEEGEIEPSQNGWISWPPGAAARDGYWRIQKGHLWCDGVTGETLLVKDRLSRFYELVINARIVDLPPEGCVGFVASLATDGSGSLFTLEMGDTGPVLAWRNLPSGSGSSGEIHTLRIEKTFELRPGFDWSRFQQYRFRKYDGRLVCQVDSEVVGEVPAVENRTRIGLYAHRAAAAFDAVRLTAIPPAAARHSTNGTQFRVKTW
jgi:hypothetical protein